jgi:hypothetical protein
MKKNTEGKADRMLSVAVGLYPGILFGFRTYEEEGETMHVLYLPFVGLFVTAFEI